MTEIKFDDLVEFIGLQLKFGADCAQAMRDIGELVNLVRTGNPIHKKRAESARLFGPVLKAATRLQRAIRADGYGIVRDRIANHLDHAAEPSFPTQSHRFFATLQAIIDFSECEKNHPLDSVTAVMSWRDHLIGVLMRGVFERNFGAAGRSVSGPFPRFVEWVFLEAGKCDLAIGVVKNALEQADAWFNNVKMTEAAKKRARLRAKKRK
jgi:hypothetical protein